MATYCSQCKTKIGLFSRKYKDFPADGSMMVLCKNCGIEAIRNIQSQFKPFMLSEGYTRIEAVLLLKDWRIPSFCVICASQEEPLSKIMQPVSNAMVNTSIPIYSCQRCSRSHLDPFMYIRYRLYSEKSTLKLTLDIGNPDVAEHYLAFLYEEFSNIKGNLQTMAIAFNVGGEIVTLSNQDFRDFAAKLGVQEVKKISAEDVDFQG